MENHDNSPNKRQDEDNYNSNQLKTIFRFLQNNTATASMVTAETGVPQKNICRYKRDLEKSGRLWEVCKDYCKETGFKAWYLSTDPTNAPERDQCSLF